MPATTLTRYTWPAGQLVQRLDVRIPSNGRGVAYLYADSSEEAREQRQALRNAIRLKGWGTLSDFRDDGYALRVSGFSDGKELLDALTGSGFATPNPETMQSQETTGPQSNSDYLRRNSLELSGKIATVGNLMSIASGIHRKREIGQIGQGAAFALADLPLAIAGKHDDSRQQTNLLRALQSHYRRSGIEVPKNASINAEVSDVGRNFGQIAKDYLHRYANQIKCSLEVVAAGFTIYAGRNQQSSWKKYAPFLWGPGFLASLVIPERKIDPERYAQAGLLERGWMLVQSNPLSIGGLLGYTNTVATYASAINERKTSLAPDGNNRRWYRWDFAIPTVMIGANGLYAISKKTGGDIRADAMVRDVYIVAAQILNKQPDALREEAIESTAKFLGERPEIQGSRAEIVARLREQMEIQRNSPWFEKTPLPAYTPQPKRGKILRAADLAVDAAGSQGSPVPVVQREGAQLASAERLAEHAR